MRLFDRSQKTPLLVGGCLAVGLLTALDYSLSWEYSLSLFYVIVIGFVSYHGGLIAGSLVAALSAIGWNATDYLTNIPYEHTSAFYWNTLIRLGMFFSFAYMMSYLKEELDLVEHLARRDALTGVVNRRHFHELAESEMHRSQRYGHPFTVVYIDLDGFKVVNDTLGHDAGDDVLRTVARTLQGNLRTTDVAARLGGDEFAVLLPETDGDAAKACLEKVQRHLLDAMETGRWAVTFSIGAVTFPTPPQSIDEVLALADSLMYSVKHGGKNAFRHEMFVATPETPSPTA